MARTGRPPHVWKRAEDALGYPTAMWVLGCLGYKMTPEEMRTDLLEKHGLDVHVNTIRSWIKKVIG